MDAKDEVAAELSLLRAVGPTLAARSRAIENNRRLPEDVVELLVASGIFRTWLPRAYGGREAPVIDGLRAIEELSYWDGSSGWCAMIGATTATLAGFLPEAAARKIFATPDTVTGGVAAPIGVARSTPGGLLVNGRWPWGSGTQHCDWIVGGCRIADDSGVPQGPVIAFFQVSQVGFCDTWHVSGLCGTGSTDFEVEEAFVPEGRWVPLLQSESVIDSPLFRFPRFGLLALGVASVCLGLARRSVAELKDLAGSKHYAGSRRTLAQRPAIQQQVAEAEAGIGAAWALIEKATARAVSAAEQGPLSSEQKAELRQAATFATVQSRRAVDGMYHAAGGTAVYLESPLQRIFRDLHVATQHQMVAPRTWELLGRLSLGLDTDGSQL